MSTKTAATETATTETKVAETAAEAKTTEVSTEKASTAVSTEFEAPMGFEDEEAGDVIIPRIKVVQTLSPERKDKIAQEGDIINSLTKEKLNGRTFIPVFKFNNNIEWKDRTDGGGIKCSASNGKIATASDGTSVVCAMCKRNEFDNSKVGKDAVPKCTKYINFFGFFVGDPMPIILSFSKTNYAEGKKLYSLAKVSMQNMWNFGYTISEKLVSKNGNEWFNLQVTPAGATQQAERDLGVSLYKAFRNQAEALKYDMDDAPVDTAPNVDKTEY